MSPITTKDGTEIYYKDWGEGPVVTFSHGWPLNADAWDRADAVPRASVVCFNALLSGRLASWETHIWEERSAITHDTASTLGCTTGRRMQ